MARDTGEDLPPTEGKTVVYTTVFTTDAANAIPQRHHVHITEGYSTFEDLRSIIAIREFGNKRPETIARITVHMAVLREGTTTT